ncbi:MAG: acyl-CoA thioesterase [Micrococcus sp.]|nr:acyl-CoA thioesterase [Micrococcus sp.]
MHLLLRTLLVILRAKRRSRLSPWDVSSVPLRALLTDVDFAWHINNGQYLGLFDLGRWDLMERAGLLQAVQRRGWLPVVQAEQIAFRRSVEFGKKFSLDTKFLGFGDRALWFEQRIVVDGEVYVRGYVLARLRAKDGHPVSDAEIREVFAELGFDPDGGEGVPAWLTQWREHIALPSARRSFPQDW